MKKKLVVNTNKPLANWNFAEYNTYVTWRAGYIPNQGNTLMLHSLQNGEHQHQQKYRKVSPNPNRSPKPNHKFESYP